MKAQKREEYPPMASPASTPSPTEAEVRTSDLEQSDDASSAESEQERIERIRQAAYERYQRRGSTPGHEEEDWLAAERDIDDKKGA